MQKKQSTKRTIEKWFFILLAFPILFIACSKNDVTTSTGTDTDSDNSGSSSSSTVTIAETSTTSAAKEGNTDSAYNADDILSNSTI